jgi:hypothetical protein
MILIPLPLFFAQTVYSVTGFSVWVIVGIIWTFLSAFTVVIYPLWESRAALGLISRGVVKVSAEILSYRTHLMVCRIFSPLGVVNLLRHLQ